MRERGRIPAVGIGLALAALVATPAAGAQHAAPAALLSSVAGESHGRRRPRPAPPTPVARPRALAALEITPRDVPARLGVIPRHHVRWSRRVLRARRGETFAPVADCRTAIEGAAETIYNFERVADAYVWGHAPAPPRLIPPTSDGVTYERRCGQARVINPRGMNARNDLDARLSWLEALQRSDAPAPGTSVLTRGDARAVIGGSVIAALAAVVFGYSNSDALETTQRGMYRWRVDPFVLGGGVGMAVGAATY